MIETILGIVAWLVIAVIGGFVLYLVFSALMAPILSSMISRDRHEQDR